MSTPTIKIKVSPRSIVKGKMDVRFPANVSVLSPIVLTRANGSFTFSFDADALAGSFATVAQGAKADSAVQSIVEGANVSIDATDPQNPIISAVSDFDTVADVEAAAISITQLALRTNGFYDAGDGGGALYKRVVSEPVHEGKIQSNDGAWWEIAELELNWRQFGARGNNSANDTAAINNCYAAAKSLGHGSVYMTSGVFLVDEAAPGCGYAIYQRGITTCGEGLINSMIAPMATMPNTVDFMLINPVNGTDLAGLALRDFIIYPGLGGTVRGKRGIYFLIDGETNVSRFQMRNVHIAPGNDKSMQIENNPSPNPQGCPSNSLIEVCAFWEGIQATYFGDNFVVRNNVLRSTAGSTRSGLLAYMTDAAGVAGHLIFEGNNVDCDGGALTVLQGREVKVLYNNIEQSAGAGSNGSVIDIDGSSGSVDGVEIRGNHVGIFGTATVTKAVRLGIADRAVIDGNVLISGITVAAGISISAFCDNTTVGVNDISGFTTPIVDSGTATGFIFRSSVQSSAFAPMTNDGAALGSANRQWSDLFLASGAVVNFNSGDVTITHSANQLAFAGALSGYAFDAVIYPNSNDGAALGSGTNSFSDLFLATGAVVNFNNGDVTVTHSANLLAFAGASSGYSFDAKVFPSANDGAALGDTTHNFSDLFLASGAVLNFNNSNLTLTHSAGRLTLAGALTATGNIIGGEVFAGAAASFGYGVNGLYSIAAGASNSYMFWGNATNNERARLQVTNARDLYFSLDNGATGHLYVDLTHANIPMTTASTSTTTGCLTLGGGLGVAGAAFLGSTLSAAGVATLASGTATPAGGSTAARLLFGTTASFGIYYGSGAPTVSAAAGSLYIRTDNAGANLRLYSNTTGSTTWAAITSA